MGDTWERKGEKRADWVCMVPVNAKTSINIKEKKWKGPGARHPDRKTIRRGEKKKERKKEGIMAGGVAVPNPGRESLSYIYRDKRTRSLWKKTASSAKRTKGAKTEKTRP